MTFIGFIICLFLTLMSGLKLVGFFVSHHAAVASGKYKGYGSMINAGILLTSLSATATMALYYFL